METLWKENGISGVKIKGNCDTNFGKRKVEAFEVMCLRSKCGIRRVDRVRNSLIREVERGHRNVVKWFGHVGRLVNRVYYATLVGNRGR